MNKWIVTAAITSGTLGLIGVFIVLYIAAVDFFDNGKSELKSNQTFSFSNNVDDNQNQKRPGVNRTRPLSGENDNKSIVIEAKEEVNKQVEQELGIDKIVKELPIKKDVTKHDRQLTRGELLELYSAITNQKLMKQNLLNCVRLHFLEGTKNLRAAKQVERFLRSKNIAIAGRQIVHNTRKGLHLNSEGSCLIVTIGSL